MSPNGDGQAPNGDSEGFGRRVRESADLVGVIAAELARRIDVPRASFGRYWNGERLPPPDVLFRLADALSVDARWLISGTRRSNRGHLAEAGSADWISVPEFDLRLIDDHGKGDLISEMLIRRDWLYSALGETQSLWLTRLLSRYGDLPTGSAVFCRDSADGEAPIDGAHYLFRVNGGIVVARFSYRSAVQSGDEARVTPADLGHDDGQHVIIARLLGALARPL